MFIKTHWLHGVQYYLYISWIHRIWDWPGTTQLSPKILQLWKLVVLLISLHQVWVLSIGLYFLYSSICCYRSLLQYGVFIMKPIPELLLRSLCWMGRWGGHTETWECYYLSDSNWGEGTCMIIDIWLFCHRIRWGWSVTSRKNLVF